MATFKEANLVRASMKMKLSNYAWYHSSKVLVESNDYIIVITVKKIDNQVKKIVAPFIDGISVKLELE